MSSQGVHGDDQHNSSTASTAAVGNGAVVHAADVHQQNADAADRNRAVEEVIDVGGLKSPVWSHYSKIRINGVVKAKCNYCKKFLVGDSNSGTTHLKNHTRICVPKKIRDGSQKILGTHYSAKGKQDLVVGGNAFNLDFSKRELAIAITMHEYPLSIVDHLYFKRFVCSLQPLFTVPCRNTIKKRCLRFMILNVKGFKVLLITIKVE